VEEAAQVGRSVWRRRQRSEVRWGGRSRGRTTGGGEATEVGRSVGRRQQRSAGRWGGGSRGRTIGVEEAAKGGLSMKLVAGILSHPIDIKSRAPCLHSGLPKHNNVLLGPARVARQAHRSRDLVTVTVSKKGLSMKLIAGILSHPVDIKSRASCLRPLRPSQAQ
jgi:hypothetical protein